MLCRLIYRFKPKISWLFFCRFLNKYTDNYYFLIYLIYLLISFEIVDYNLLIFTSVLIYDNADTQKEQIIKDSTGKAGIYLWRNLINQKKIYWLFYWSPKKISWILESELFK